MLYFLTSDLKAGGKTVMFAVVVITNENIKEIEEHFKHDSYVLQLLGDRDSGRNLLVMNPNSATYLGLSKSTEFAFENWYLDFPCLDEVLALGLITSEKARRAYKKLYVSNTVPKALQEKASVSTS